MQAYSEFTPSTPALCMPLNSVHCKEVGGYLEEIIKLIEEKVIMEDIGEENNLKNGMPAATMYSDRTHTYITCWPDGEKNRRRYVRRLGYAPERTGMLLTSSCSHDCCEEQVEQTLSAKTVKDVTWLLFDDSSDLGLQLERINAVYGRIHRMLKLGHLNIDDDDEGLGDDDDLKFKRSGPGGKSCMTGRMLNSSNSAGVGALHEVYFDAVRGQPRDGWWRYEVSEFMD